MCACASVPSSVRRGLKASSIINVMASRVASNVPLAPDGIPEYQCITHTRYDSGHVTNSVSVCHREANSAQCRPCVNSCDMNPPPNITTTLPHPTQPLLLLLSTPTHPPPSLQEKGFGGSEGGAEEAKGDGRQGWTRTEPHSLTSLHGGRDAHSMYEKLTMLNLQSSSNWSGPNNWYHDPTGIQTQHSTGENKAAERSCRIIHKNGTNLCLEQFFLLR